MAREGWPFVGAALGPALLCAWASEQHPSLVYGAGFFAVLSAFMLFFFRDPARSVPAGKGLIVSAADGKVVEIEDIGEEKYLRERGVQISVFLSPLDVHINRVPFSGVVDFVRWQRGRFRAAFVAAASTENEQSVIGIRNGSARVVVKQIVGVLARRIVCRLQRGDTVWAGSRFGLIRFGSRVDLIVPERAEVQVKVGDRVRAGETIVGVLHDTL